MPKRLVGKAYQEAAAKGKPSQVKLENGDSTTKEAFPAKRTSSSKICEVVITVPKSQARAVAEISDSESDPLPRKRIQRKASKKVIVIDSDDDETGDGHGSDYEDEGPQDDQADDDDFGDTSDDADDHPSTKSRSKRSRKPSPPPTSSSDDGVGDSSDAEIDEDEDDVKKGGKPKPKGKYGVKAAPKRKAMKKSAKSSGEDTDSMEVDDPPSSPASSKTSKKRKTTASDDKPAKKQKRREDTDPWKLETTAVKKDWTQTRAPPLEVFHFSRIVVDEYTYLSGKVHSMVTKLTGDRRWVLSGTPPIHDFGSVKTIAAHLNLHLGIDDDGEGKSAMIKKRIREQTSTIPMAKQIERANYHYRGGRVPFVP